MDRGYIKMWRRSLDNDWLKNHELWVVWSYCLLKASYKERIVEVGHQQVVLKPGQFIFGRKRASQELNMSEWKIRQCIDSLRKRRNIAIKTTNKFSIITIVNWDIYQGGKVSNPPAKPPTDRQQTANKPPQTIKKECKNKNTSTCLFDIFWGAYPIKRNKGQAQKTWDKLSEQKKLPDLTIILNAIDVQKNTKKWQKDDGQYIPYPSTWLNNKGWLDEIEEGASKCKTPVWM